MLWFSSNVTVLVWMGPCRAQSLRGRALLGTPLGEVGTCSSKGKSMH